MGVEELELFAALSMPNGIAVPYLEVVPPCTHTDMHTLLVGLTLQ